MPKSVVENWRLYENRYNLIGQVCSACGKKYYPKALICTKCGSAKLESCKLAEEGTIYSFSSVKVSPRRLQKQTPYVVALIKLKDGLVISSQIVGTDYDKIKIGDKVKAIFRKIHQEESEEVIAYGTKFRLV